MRDSFPKVPDQGQLPDQFASLQPFVDAGWAQPERRDRTEKRLQSSFADLNAVYEAVGPRLQEILDFLDKHPLAQLSDDQARLLQLAFAVADLRNAVENFGQPDVVDGWDTRRFILEDIC